MGYNKHINKTTTEFKMKDLTTKNAKTLIGKKIKWNAPADHANADYEGVAIIKEVDFSKNHPLLVETVSGDSLEYAFLDKTLQGDILYEEFCYSDADRFVMFDFA